MRIFYDTGVDLSQRGGATTHILEKTSALRRQGVEVEVWAHRTPHTNGPPPPGIRQFAVPLRAPWLRHISYLAYEAGATWTVLRAPRRGTIILARQRIFGAGVLICARLRRLPIVYEVNDDIFDQLSLAGKLSTAKRCVVGTLLGAGARQATSVLALTPQLKKLCLDRYGFRDADVHVVPVGCDLIRFTPMESKECQERVGLDPAFRYIANVSSFTPWSGIDLTIKLMPLLLAREPRLRLLLVGDGATMETARALADGLGVSHAVLFVGSVPYARVPLYMNAAEACFCVKSEKLMTTSPTRLYEYLGCGKPVFVTKGYRETVPTEALIEVSSRDPEGASRSVLDLLADGGRRRELGEEARSYAVRNAGWDAVGKTVASVFAALSGRVRRAPSKA